MVQNVEPQNLQSRKKKKKKKKKTPFYYVHQFSKKMRPTHIINRLGLFFFFFMKYL